VNTAHGCATYRPEPKAGKCCLRSRATTFIASLKTLVRPSLEIDQMKDGFFLIGGKHTRRATISNSSLCPMRRKCGWRSTTTEAT